MAKVEKAECRFCKTFTATGATLEEAFTKLSTHIAKEHPEEAEEIRKREQSGKATDELKLY